jgi:hypothetical protein
VTQHLVRQVERREPIRVVGLGELPPRCVQLLCRGLLRDAQPEARVACLEAAVILAIVLAVAVGRARLGGLVEIDARDRPC